LSLEALPGVDDHRERNEPPRVKYAQWRIGPASLIRENSKSTAAEIQLLEQAKHLSEQITATEQNTVTIFAALLIADAIRESVGQLTWVISEKWE
jgi:hypothetical protein